jgi:ABC-type enterobactin transport system permease subunit
LLLVSALGGVVFAAAALADNLENGIRTDPSVIIVHVGIGAASTAVLAWFLVAPMREQGRLHRRP